MAPRQKPCVHGPALFATGCWSKLGQQKNQAFIANRAAPPAGCDMLIALQPEKSAEAVRLSREGRHRGAPWVGCLTGTDSCYNGHPPGPAGRRRSLELAGNG